MQTPFSAGVLYGTRVDVPNIGPDQFGLLQSVNIDFGFDTKRLYGERQYPAVLARGQASVTGKATHARIFGACYANIFFGETIAGGAVQTAQDEPQTIPGVSTFTVDVDNSDDWFQDLGVYDVTAGTRMTYVDGPPAEGQYSVVSGTYTFSEYDASKAVKISYLYAGATGKKMTINSQLQGITPTFSMLLHNVGRTQRGEAPMTLALNLCTSSKLSLPLRMSEFGMPEFDFEAFADENDVVGTWSFAE